MEFFRRIAPGVMFAFAMAGSTASAQDFNGDGFTDMAVGTPFEDVGAAVDAGAVTVIFGAGPGLGLDAAAPIPAGLITQAIVGEAVEPGDNFGAAICWGDFNGDGFDDLAISAPSESHPISGIAGTGMVIVLYGSAIGLGPAFPAIIVQDPAAGGPGLGDPGEALDALGFSLAAGDFDGDTFDDLAIGVPGEDPPGGPADAGQVHILMGSPVGLSPTAPLPIIVQGVMPWGNPSEAGDGFGWTLAAGDLNGDGADDLVFGTPNEDLGADVDCGVVNVAYGLALTGIIPGGPVPAETWSQDSGCIPEATDPADQFGTTLAIGNFDGMFGEDLAIGCEFEDIGANVDCGATTVIYSGGLATGLEGCLGPAPVAAEIWHQNSAGVPDANSPGDFNGSALAAGDFNGDGWADLAWGVEGEDMGTAAAPVIDCGCVMVVYGGGPGLGLDAAAAVPAQFWHLNSAGIPRVRRSDQFMGRSLTVGNFDGVLGLDLSIGVPEEDFGALVDVGCVITIYSAGPAGLASAAPVIPEQWHQNIASIPDANEAGDQWGTSLDIDD